MKSSIRYFPMINILVAICSSKVAWRKGAFNVFVEVPVARKAVNLITK